MLVKLLTRFWGCGYVVDEIFRGDGNTVCKVLRCNWLLVRFSNVLATPLIRFRVALAILLARLRGVGHIVC